ncbi:MAG: DNA (cytosine-5-)-methyltransferase [Victivallales bacterium]|nr:DNA (cytosine-5-)-methyltransferase [Victivallales bacterium]
MTTFSSIDLFAGIGGFRLAVERNGGTCSHFSEINRDAIDAYLTNFPDSNHTNLGDITKLKSLPQHDFLTGGVPCQSWSIAGRNLGFDDDRGQLWNDALFLLNQSRPKAFMFENVKGLADPRNQKALEYILKRIQAAGYHARHYVLNSFEYGVPQSRVRIYIIGFREKKFQDAFSLPAKARKKIRLAEILDGLEHQGNFQDSGLPPELDLFGNPISDRRKSSTSLSRNNNGLNDYFLLNDLRNGCTTIHSWDLLETTEKQKEICLLLLRNRRKKIFGCLDGNPLSLSQFQTLNHAITQEDIDGLVKSGILKPEKYAFSVITATKTLNEQEKLVISFERNGKLVIDELSRERIFKVKKVKLNPLLEEMEAKGIVRCDEIRYDFRFTKISTGLFGVNRIFLPSSNIFPTLVASDSNDYVTTVSLHAPEASEYRRQFIKKIWLPRNFRRITKCEACRIQGFPADFVLPNARARWMKLLGNSVSVSVIEQLVKSICATGVFS